MRRGEMRKLKTGEIERFFFAECLLSEGDLEDQL